MIIFWAASFGAMDELEFLLEDHSHSLLRIIDMNPHFKVDDTDDSYNNATALMYAAANDQMKIVNFWWKTRLQMLICWTISTTLPYIMQHTMVMN